MLSPRLVAATLVLSFGPSVCLEAAAKESNQQKKTTRPSHANRASNYSSRTIQQWMAGMDLRTKVAQLIVVSSYGESPSSRSAAYRDFAHAVRDLRVGGMIVVNRVVGGSVRNAEPHAMASFLNRMQRLATVPLLVGADFERGASMRVANTPKYPHLMAYGAAGNLRLTSQLGLATAREARALGVHWVFAPDADVNNNPDNPVINIRSFGENPAAVAEHVKAFLAGAQSDPASRVLLTVKHFPGHGDTSVDSHMGLPSLSADRARLESTEFVPFRAAIEAGVDSVMTAHMAVPALGADDVPATASKPVLTGVLRGELKFSGLIVTDAMDMAGLTKQMPGGEAAIRALEAGADVLLMPPSAEVAIKSIVAAVRQGRLTERRIEESVLRVLQAKERVGLHRGKLVDIEAVNDTLDSTESAEQAQAAADQAVTLVRNERGSVPLKNPDGTCFFILTESRYGQQGRRMLDELRSRNKSLRALLFDPQISAAEIEQLLEQNKTCETNVVAAFITAAAYRGNVALSGNYGALMSTLLERPAPSVLVSLGSPYLLRHFPQVSSYLATMSPVLTSETAAVRALFGEISVSGRLPVSIPPIAKYGDGIVTSR